MMTASVAGVVGVARENCARAVELLGHDESGEGVSQGESSERQQEAGAGACRLGPAIGGADGEDDVLRAFITAGSEPGGERFRG